MTPEKNVNEEIARGIILRIFADKLPVDYQSGTPLEIAIKDALDDKDKKLKNLKPPMYVVEDGNKVRLFECENCATLQQKVTEYEKALEKIMVDGCCSCDSVSGIAEEALSKWRKP